MIGLVAVIAGLLLWVELLVRASLVYLLVAISPLGFAATLWPAARGFLRKTIEILLAVILSKFVICVALAIGVAALSGAGDAGTGQSVPGGGGRKPRHAPRGDGPARACRVLALHRPEAHPGRRGRSPRARHLARSGTRAQTGLSTYSSTRMISRLSGSSGSGQGGNAIAPAGAPDAAATAGGSGPGVGIGASAGAGTAAAGTGGGAVIVGAGAAAGKAKEAAQRSAATAGSAADAPKTEGGDDQ